MPHACLSLILQTLHDHDTMVLSSTERRASMWMLGTYQHLISTMLGVQRFAAKHLGSDALSVASVLCTRTGHVVMVLVVDERLVRPLVRKIWLGRTHVMLGS